MATKKGDKDPNDVQPSADDAPPEMTASQFAPPPVSAHNSFSILTEGEAELKGDYAALARIRLANAARELNEQFDVNGDGVVPKSGGKKVERSVLYRRDKFGGYYSKKGHYHDRFGGYYDDYGYHDKSGSYTTTSGARWHAATGKMTNADGTERTVSSEAVQEVLNKNPELGQTITQIDEQFNQEENPSNGAGKKIDTRAASETEGGGRTPVTSQTSAESRQKTEYVIEERQADGRRLTGPATTAEMERANERYKWKNQRIDSRRTALSEFIISQSVTDTLDAGAVAPAEVRQADTTWRRGASRQPQFEAVSKEEVAAKIGHIRIPAKAATPGKQAAAATTGEEIKKSAGETGNSVQQGAPDDKSRETKTEASTAGTQWYKDERGNYWDECGGCYDTDGGYWEADGGYWDQFNNYTDENGGRHYADGSYLDPDFNYVNEDGVYIMSDGTQIKPPAGMDFKKQMQEAAEKNEKWTLPAELTPILQSYTPFMPTLNLAPASLVPPLLAADPVPKVEPVSGIDTTIKIEPVSLKSEPFKLAPSLDLPPLNLGASTAPPTVVNTSFSLLDPKQNSTSAKCDNAFNVDTSRFQYTAQGKTKNDFSSFFNNYHTFLSSSKPTAETKFYDLSNITLSPSIDSKPMFASLTTPADKNAGSPPKNNLA